MTNPSNFPFKVVPPIFQFDSINRNHRIYPESVFIKGNFALTLKAVINLREDVLLTYNPYHGQMFSPLGEILCNVLESKGDKKNLDSYKELTILGKYSSGHAIDRQQYSGQVANNLADIYSDPNNIVEMIILQEELMAMKGQFATTDMYKTLLNGINEFIKVALN